VVLILVAEHGRLSEAIASFFYLCLRSDLLNWLLTVGSHRLFIACYGGIPLSSRNIASLFRFLRIDETQIGSDERRS